MKILYLLLLLPLVTGDRIVNTNSGPIRGISVAGKKVEAFLSIPYAEPPVGELRFAKPAPKSPWEQIYDANTMPPSCIQATLEKTTFLAALIDTNHLDTTEDCLFLNLWVPESESHLKPIIVFIHGGGFMLGGSDWDIYNGTSLSKHGDVIVATINYRLGTLGFFSAFIDEAAGNMGMYDQVMAIQWIKDNAKHFGGDPDNIVLMGESAGAFSVSLHMVSPLSKNLFRRSILQSGSAYHPMYSDDNIGISNGSQAVASLLGCATDSDSLKNNPKEVVDCMKGLPAEKFTESDSTMLKTGGMLTPRVGDDFLPKNPIDLYQSGSFKENEVLIGVNRNEGTAAMLIFQPEIAGTFGEKVNGSTFNESSAKKLLQSKMGMNSEIFQNYFDRAKDVSRYSYLDAVSDIRGDFLINCGAVFQADYQSLKNVLVYFYLFDYRSPSSPLAEWVGVPHFEEVPYVFGNPLYKDFSESEEEFSNDIMDMWIAFARTGNPNIPGGLRWPPYSFKNPEYYILGQRDAVGVRPDQFRCEMWKEFFRSCHFDMYN